LGESHSTTSGNFKDSTANPTHGTLTDANSSSSSQASIIGNAISFSGDADSIDVGNPSKLQITNSMTISAWIQLQDYSAGANRILSKSGLNGNLGWEFSRDDWIGPNWNNLTLFTPATGSTFAAGYHEASLPAGQWVYAAVAYDAAAQTVRLYRDGLAIATTIAGTIPASINSTPYSVKIGARAGNSGTPFHGNIDEVRISSVVRSADWIRTEYSNQISPASFYAIVPEQ